MTKTRVDDEDKYCDPDLSKQIVFEKEDMGNYSQKQKHIMRQTANEYEKVKSAFFQNREAMKLAALDQMFNFVLTNESDEKKRISKNPMLSHHRKTNEFSRDEETFFFADVGGGPGAHAEFLIWRKGFYNARANHPTQPNQMGDYEQKRFTAGSFAFFDTYYGIKGNGDICDPENLKSFERYVKEKTDGKGVHLVVCDGALDPDGRETRQELFHNRLFLCEFISALSLCQIDQGNFVCKLYDTVTPFTVGLIYLMWVAFDEIAICKPVSVRPACSEKFLVCKKLTETGATVIKEYLTYVNEQFDNLPEGMDITQVVPKSRLDLDARFVKFIMEHNRKVFLGQINSLQFYKKCLKNSNLAPKNQNEARVEALKYWNIPDISRDVTIGYEHMSDIFNKFSRGFDLKRFYHIFAYSDQSTFRTLPRLNGAQNVLSEFAVQMLNSGEHRILMSDNRGYIHILQPNNQMIKGMKNAEFNGFPPRSIVLIQHKKGNFGPEAQNYPIRIIDAAVLANDEVAFLPLFLRLKYAKKFAQNAVVRFNGQRIPLEVTSAYSLGVAQMKSFAENIHGTLKISRLYKKEYNLIWNKDKRCEEIIHTPTMDIVKKESRIYSSFWDNLYLACKVSDWANASYNFTTKIVEIHRKFCISNDLSDAEDDEIVP
uniref:Cap-specific mRNA (nucleoside-2'-O-)-methyltransferase 1 n=1 Tax=Panagrolaimus superbus TaxID=310955 RepID=A0A914XUX2_9BILA